MVDNIDVKQIFRPVSSTTKVKKLNGYRDNEEQRRFERDLEEKKGQHKEESVTEHPSKVSKGDKMKEGKEKKVDLEDSDDQNTSIGREKGNPHQGRKIDILV